MRIKELKDNQIYRNAKNHIVLTHGKFVVYIDVGKDAIVYTTIDTIRAEDWTLYLPQEDIAIEEPPFTPDEFFSDTQLVPETLFSEQPKKRGRPRKV